MAKQEKSQWKGGLLGDEMGMGKTIQAVSLIMSDYPAKDPTLVVVVSFRGSCSTAHHQSYSSIVLSPHTFGSIAVFLRHRNKMATVLHGRLVQSA